MNPKQPDQEGGSGKKSKDKLEGAPVSIYFPADALATIDANRQSAGRDGRPMSRSAFVRLRALEGSAGLTPAEKALLHRLSVQLRRAGVNLNSLIKDARLAPYRGEEGVSIGRAQSILDDIEASVVQIGLAVRRTLKNSHLAREAEPGGEAQQRQLRTAGRGAIDFKSATRPSRYRGTGEGS